MIVDHPVHPDQTTLATAAGRNAVLWRYVAVERNGSRQRRSGELAGETAADVRAALRRIGLQAIEVKPLRRRAIRTIAPGAGLIAGIRMDVGDWWHRQCRARGGRAAQRAEMYDSLATMLESGLPLLEAVQTLVESRGDDREARRAIRLSGGSRAMLVEMRERLRGGDSLAQAMQAHTDWFGPIDIAIVEAGQHSGMLAMVLRNLAERQERSSELSHKLWGALAYPLLVLLVGLAVVVFLSVKTLPDLTKILVDAGIPVPALTARVMWAGQMLAEHWLTLMMVIAAGVATVAVLPAIARSMPVEWPLWIRSIFARVRAPRVIRQLLVGGLVMQLADLLRSGVPMVEALRIVAPTQRSPRLRKRLVEAAQHIERGDELSAALDDGGGGGGGWFDSELRRLLDIGQASGELDAMLTRIGERYQRRAKRLIDRLTVLLEPAVLLALALLVGVVVMAAILPLLALQEII